MARNPFRRVPQPQASLTAAATPVDLADSSIIQHVLRTRQKWQTQAFEAYDACGELKYGVNFLASLISRLTLFVAEHDATDPEAEPTAVTDPAITEQFARLGTVVERSELQRELAIQLLVPGEGYLVGIQPGKEPWRPVSERWEMRSIDEVVESGDSVVIVASPTDDQPIRLTREAGDTFIRIYRQHARYSDYADSHVRPILSTIEELLWVDSAFTAIAKNRLVTAGVFEVPQSMEAPATTPEESKMTGSQRLAKKLWEAALRAIQNPAAAEAAVPIFVTYPDNEARKSGMNHNEIKRPQDEALLARNDYLLRRIAQGLNLPVEIVFGLGQATHWGGGQVEECLAPETKVLTSDLRWVEVGSLKEDDELAAFEEHAANGRDRVWQTSQVEKVGRAKLESYEVLMADGTTFVASANHQWLFRSNHHPARWVTTEWLFNKQTDTHRPLGPNAGVVKALNTWEHDDSWEAGYLAGVFDGEGFVTKATPLCVGFGQRENICLDRTETYAANLGFDFRRYKAATASVNGDVIPLNLRGGVKEVIRFLGQVRPARLLEKWENLGGPESLGSFRGTTVPVVSVTPVGEREVVTLKTSTGTLVAEGFAHHNSVFREHVEPLVLLIVSALTTAWLRPILEQLPGVDDSSRYLIWYDNSNLIVHPKKEEAADKGVEYGAISLPAWRRVRGFSETDAPSAEEREEIMEWLKALRGKDPQPSPDQPNDPNATPTQPDAPGERAPEDDGTTGPMKGKGQDILTSSANGHSPTAHIDLGRRLADIDHDLLTRLQVMAHEKVSRARERAGNKLKNRAKRIPEHREPLRNISPEDVARTLGPSIVASIGGDDLFSDAFTAVPAMFEKWCMQAVDAVTKLVPQYSMSAEARTRIHRNITRAAATFRDDLENLSASLLYSNPADASTSPTPEDADLLVPASLVRKSLAMAGGAADHTGVLLLATGHTFHKELATVGHFPTAYQWSYGSRLRAPFTAHQQLDGQTFSLSNSPIKPGEGSDECLCLAIPVYNS